MLILDIESGSVGAALARRTGDTLTILNEIRSHAPVRPHRTAQALAGDIERLAQSAITKMSEFAAKLRSQSPGPALGDVSQVAVFMAPPWGRPNLETNTPDFVPHMQEVLRRELSPYFSSPASFHTNAGGAVQGLRAAGLAGGPSGEDKYLLCIVTHEVTELLLIHHGAVVGHATIPHGINLPLRTLRAHGGLSDHEARSALKLGHLNEPLQSATDSFAQEFLAAGRELFDAYHPERVWVISPMGEYFARALSHPMLGELFPQGGEVRALGAHHIVPSLADGQRHDLFILLETLFVLYS